MTLFKDLEKIKISLEYDTLTIYPKEEKNSEQITSYIKQCEDILSESGCISEFSAMDTYQRNIFRSDSDHDLYHRDGFNVDDLHCHFKYTKHINRHYFEIILNLAERYDLITLKEMQAVLADYDKKYILDVTIQAVKLTKWKSQRQAKEGLDNFIAICADNAVLVALHDELLKPKYQFLRKEKDDDKCKLTSPVKQTPYWQGVVSLDGKIARTSSTWAHIEKSIELQMMKNTKDLATKFSQRIAKEHCEEYSHHPFFGIKRLVKPDKIRNVSIIRVLDYLCEAIVVNCLKNTKSIFLL